MKKQVILDFLNLPGILGVGLMDGHSRPYFSGIDRLLNFQQKEALTQGIQQVVSTTPPGFESFDFRFAQKEAHIYRLGTGVILLVVTHESVDGAIYQDLVQALKETLESDPHSAVSTFRLLAGSTTLNRPMVDVKTELNKVPAQPDLSSASPPPPVPAYNWKAALDALNQLTEATAQYLGKIVVANTWRSTRPPEEAPTAIAIDRNGHFSLASGSTLSGTTPIGPEDLQALRTWVAQFIQRCALIIRDYPDLVLKQALDDHQRDLLQIILSP